MQTTTLKPMANHRPGYFYGSGEEARVFDGVEFTDGARGMVMAVKKNGRIKVRWAADAGRVARSSVVSVQNLRLLGRG